VTVGQFKQGYQARRFLLKRRYMKKGIPNSDVIMPTGMSER